MGRVSTMYRGLSAVVSTAVVFLAACGSDSPGAPSGPTATGIAIVSGNYQLAHYGTPVAAPLKVKLTNGTAPVAGVQVTFTPASGSGSVTGSTVSTDANGIATLGSWTLGAAPGSDTLTATAGTLTATFTATATAGAASAMTITAGDNQNGIERSQISTPLKVTVTDGQYPVRGMQVDFAVASGGGTITNPGQVTDANGVATLTTWKLGSLGANTVTATVRGISTIPMVTFTATAAALQLKPMLVVEGATMGGFFGNFAPKQARVELRNQFDQPAEGVEVTFAVTSGGGSIVKAVDTTGTDGRAEVGAWRLGNGTTQTLSASVTNIAAPPAPAAMTANVTAVPASTFHITIRYQGATPSAEVQAAFTAAANKWQSVIVGDLEDIVTTATDTMEAVNINGRNCVPVIKNETIDDVVIYATVDAIDGPGRILGFATPIYTRISDGTAISGCMVFDEDDLETLAAHGDALVATITHEMGHVLGSGTMSMSKSIGVCDRLTGIGGVPYFIGSSARQAFRAALGTGVVWTREMVPLEGAGNCFDGTHDAHWSEGIFVNELMTGYIDPASNPLSAITASQMRDINYTVNDLAADPYTVPFGLPALRAGGDVIKLNEMQVTEPIRMVDRRGRVTRLIER